MCEYSGAGLPQRWFAYGNYIDEDLVMNTSSSIVLAETRDSHLFFC
jgi:hypothetical protein